MRTERTMRGAMVTLALALVCVAHLASMAHAQCGGNFQRQSVGGVSIDPAGVLKNVDRKASAELQQAMQRVLHEVPGDLREFAPLRKVSLRRLEEALAAGLKSGMPLADEMRLLAGLQRVQYVFVVPEQQDIILAGPAEGWRVDPQGVMVGRTTGRPVMLLDDLLVALRSMDSARRTGMSCSIDPQQAGLTRLQNLVKTLRGIGPNPQATLDSIEEALGPQKITVTGVPATSHFARVMVAADFKMKRLAMNFEPAPVAGLPSFLEMMKAGPAGIQNMLPRWWLEPNYESLLADPSGLAYEFRKASVKALTEDDFPAAGGARQHTGKANPVAQKWADNMTAKYDELALKDSIFGQLRNCIDLAVVAALITHERLTDKCGHSFPLLFSGDMLEVEHFNAPQTVATQASFVKKGSNWLISASGGVQMNPWAVFQHAETSSQPGAARAKALAAGTSWWWN